MSTFPREQKSALVSIDWNSKLFHGWGEKTSVSPIRSPEGEM